VTAWRLLQMSHQV